MTLRKIVAACLRAFIALGAAFIVFEIACWIHPPVMAWGLAVAGRAEICSAPDVYTGTARTLAIRDREKKIAMGAKLGRHDGELSLWNTPDGDWWIPTGGETVLPLLLAQQRTSIYDNQTIKGKVVLDCGAHIGLYSREALESGAERVIAIEPSPVNLECLRRNVELMGGGNGRVTVYPKGVWDEEKKLQFFHTPTNSAGDSFVAKVEGDQVLEEIPVTTIDRIAEELKLPSVDVIKMDIKGATIRALNGAKSVVAKYHPKFAISTEEREDSAQEIIQWMKAHGYRLRCGSCVVGATMIVSPDVLFFEQ